MSQRHSAFGVTSFIETDLIRPVTFLPQPASVDRQPMPPTLTIRTVNVWRDWMHAASLSNRTITEWVRILTRLSEFASDDPCRLEWTDLAAWLASLTIGASSRRCYIAAIRAYYTWVVSIAELRLDNPAMKLPRLRVPRATPRPVTTDELARALTSGRFYRHTRTMILLGAYQGLRACEIARVAGQDIRNDTIRVIGKGGTDYTLPLHPLIAAESEHYPQIGWWFPSPKDRHQPVQARAVSQCVSRALKRAGVSATCHQLRHWFGTELLESAQGNLRIVQEGLRHANVSTTTIYTRVRDEQLRAAVNALPAPGYSIPLYRRKP